MNFVFKNVYAGPHDLLLCWLLKLVNDSVLSPFYSGCTRSYHSSYHFYFVCLFQIILPYTANTEHLQQPTPHVITSKVDVVTDVILTEYFSTEAIKNYLFPEGRMLVNTVPYRLMRENIPLIMDKSGFTEILSDVVLGNNNNKCTGLLTVGTIYPVKRPKFAYNIEIYGDCVISLDAHIACHLERIANKAYGRVSIHVVVGDKVSRTQVDKVMLQYGVVTDKARITSGQEEPVIKRTLV